MAVYDRSRAQVVWALMLVFVLAMPLGVAGAGVGTAQVDPNVTGRVVDADGGAPIEGAVIEVFQWHADHAAWTWFTRTETDSTGEYDLALPDGTYRISAEALHYRGHYYEDADQFDDAADIVVAGGVAIPSVVDFALMPIAPAITGTVTDASTGEPIEEAWVAAWFYDEVSEVWQQVASPTPTDSDGTYLIGDIEADSYIVSFFRHRYHRQYFDGKAAMEEADLVVYNGTDVVTGVDAALDRREVAYKTIAGKTRIETAVDIAWEAFPDGLDPEGPRTILLATGDNWPDALGGTALAGVLDAPILLTHTNVVPKVVLDAIVDLGAENVTILGGLAAVSTQVEADLAVELGDEGVDRIAGRDRYETADLIAKRVIETADEDFLGYGLVATGGNFPDAIAAAPLAAAHGVPLLLVPPKATKAPAVPEEIDKAIILGGMSVVSNDVREDLYSDTLWKVDRLGGKDRYETAVLVADHAIGEFGLNKWDVALATGEDYADALTGGVLQGRKSSVMLLTSPRVLPPATAAFIAVSLIEIESVTFIGGDAAIGPDVRAHVAALLAF